MTAKQVKIMIVDDHQIFIDGIKALLINVSNMSVSACSNNGRDAIAILEKKAIDLVLMDIEMPILNGYEATALITSCYPNIKVIALTAHDEKSIVKKMLDAGASGYILKNINRETLVEAINTVMKGQPYYSSEIPIALASSSIEEKGHTENKTHFTTLLSAREIEILKHIANGLSNNEIAKKLYLSPKTIDTHRTNIMQKLDIHNVVGLVKYAIKSGLLD
jgi:DNA-binding NarL/FixJ family response regulator